MTSKKLTRSRRKDLRAKGQLKVVPRLDEGHKAAERRAEEEAASARDRKAHRAQEEIAHPDDEKEAEPAPAKKKPRDHTVLLLVALTAAAGLIVWLIQRGPSEPEPAKAAASASARAPLIVTTPRKPAPPQGTTP